MKKLLAILLTVLTLSLLGMVAYAEESTADIIPNESGTTQITSTPKIDKNDPLYISLQEKNTTRKAMIEEEKQILTGISAAQQANSALRKDLVLDKKAANKDVIQNLEAQITAAKAQVQPLTEQKIALMTALSTAIKGKDKTEVKNLKDQLNAVNQQLKDKAAAVKTLRESIAAEKGKNSGVNDTLKLAKSQLSEINTQILELHSGILLLRASKEKEWIQFHNSIKAVDLSAANTHMTNIVNYKQQIIDKLKQILTLKQQIQTTLLSLEQASEAATSAADTATQTNL